MWISHIHSFLHYGMFLAVGRGNKRIAVSASYVGRIALVSTDLNFIKSAVVFCSAMVSAAYYAAFNTSVFVIAVHNIYPPYAVCFYCAHFYCSKNEEKYGKFNVYRKKENAFAFSKKAQTVRVSP